MNINCLLHVHSSFSYDSKTDLSEVAAIARAHGIGCVLVTEHNNFLDDAQVGRLVARCAELSNGSLLMIPGLELAFDSNRVHLLAFGIRRYIDSVSPGTTFRSLIDAVHEAGGVAVLAHPSHRRAASTLDPADLRRLDGIEVWNVKNGNRFFPMVEDIDLLHQVRRAAGRDVFAFAGLDWHHANKFTRIVLRLEAAALTQESILESLRRGRFTIHCAGIELSSTAAISRPRAIAYRLASRSLAATRRIGYRWQSALERKGFRAPRLILAAARRLF